MRHFRHGRFERHRIPSSLRGFCPTEALRALEDIDLEALWAAGKRLILLDVDNTLLPWRSRDIPASTHDWIRAAKTLGFQFCVLSNTRHPERLTALCSEMGVDYVRDKFKPSRKMYLIALERYGVPAEQAVMVGDQLLTDVLGANRAGIDAVWVKPLGPKEFVGTRVLSRNVERVIGKFLYRYFQATESNEPSEPTKTGFFGHNLVRQFGKFVIVGGTSTVIDFTVLFVLMFWIKPGGEELGTIVGRNLIAQYPHLFEGWITRTSDAAVPVFQPIASTIALLNSFAFNRMWTFRISGNEDKGLQFRRFLVVSLSAMFLNWVITTKLNSVVPGHPKVSLAVAKAVATVVVAFWNFFGQKLWAFKPRSESDQDGSLPQVPQGESGT
ncbi:MAG: YqeG family HAD IIIA-type phosphatase [Armatimonadetes bacterium]|nr:YqeG family HAD IIIA-type phosphatase [Armatimonadota bacterium]